jgi:hypothetical protein
MATIEDVSVVTNFDGHRYATLRDVLSRRTDLLGTEGLADL